jgi:hypothetical protein
VGDPAPSAFIDGQGQCSVSGGSPRLYMDAPNRNVEFVGEFKVGASDDVKEVYLVARSNHEDRPKGFGGYYYYLNFKDKKAYFKKEQTHELGYSPRLDEKVIQWEPDEWVTAKIVVVDNGKKVELQGHFNGIYLNHWVDDGSVKGPAFQGIGKWCFVRVNFGDNPGAANSRNVKIAKI